MKYLSAILGIAAVLSVSEPAAAATIFFDQTSDVSFEIPEGWTACDGVTRASLKGEGPKGRMQALCSGFDNTGGARMIGKPDGSFALSIALAENGGVSLDELKDATPEAISAGSALMCEQVFHIAPNTMPCSFELASVAGQKAIVGHVHQTDVLYDASRIVMTFGHRGASYIFLVANPSATNDALMDQIISSTRVGERSTVIDSLSGNATGLTVSSSSADGSSISNESIAANGGTQGSFGNIPTKKLHFAMGPGISLEVPGGWTGCDSETAAQLGTPPATGEVKKVCDIVDPSIGARIIISPRDGSTITLAPIPSGLFTASFLASVTDQEVAAQSESMCQNVMHNPINGPPCKTDVGIVDGKRSIVGHLMARDGKLETLRMLIVPLGEGSVDIMLLTPLPTAKTEALVDAIVSSIRVE